MGDDLAQQLVDGINETYGSHVGHRAVHAKGVLCAATFTPSDSASALSRAPHFAGDSVPAHVRFSNGSGDPTIPDGTRDARGMAVKFYLPNGNTTDIVALSLPVFFTRTPEDLLAFNEARRPDPATGQPDMDKVGAFLAEHPETVPAVTAAITHPTPASYCGLTYHSIHAFGFVAGDDTVRYGRYHLVPESGEETLTEEEAATKSADYLAEELKARFQRRPATFGLDLQLAADGDPLDDPTAEWPTDRDVVRLGRLDLTSVAFDRERDGDILVFDPTRVPDGIRLTDDKILLARPGAYSVSVTRRTSA
jgi:catalase